MKAHISLVLTTLSYHLPDQTVARPKVSIGSHRLHLRLLHVSELPTNGTHLLRFQTSCTIEQRAGYLVFSSSSSSSSSIFTALNEQLAVGLAPSQSSTEE